MIFCDTSAAVKVYVREAGSSEIARLFPKHNEICLSELARVELISVFHRRLREGIWDKTDFDGAVSQFSKDDISGFWTWLPLDRSIIEAATKTYTTLPKTVFLRASDCLHLITAQHYNFSEIYTYDTHQTKAAAVFGIKAATG
jgi:predicted nucleic acid-binding protein